MRARFSAPLVVSALVSLVAACGTPPQAGSFDPSGGRGSASPSTTAPSSAVASTPAPSSSTAQAILAQYRRFQKLYEASWASNDVGELSDVAGGRMLRKVRDELAAHRRKGEFWRFHNVVNPRVANMPNDTTAIVVDCVHTLDSYRFDADTGRRLGGDSTGGFQNYTAVMKLIDGTWKVSNGKGEAVEKC